MSLVGVGRWQGDSIAAWYAGILGISIFDYEGVFARTLFLRSEQSVNWLRPRPEAVRQDGTLMSRRELEEDLSVVVEIWDGAGSLSASLGQHSGDEVILTTHDRGSRVITHIAYGRRLVTGLWGDLVVISPTSRYEIRAFLEDGTLDRIVRRDHEPRAPTEADRAPYVEDQMIHILATPELPEQIVEEARSHFLGAPFAETFPAFTSVMTDAAGNLWVGGIRVPAGRSAGRTLDRLRSRGAGSRPGSWRRLRGWRSSRSVKTTSWARPRTNSKWSMCRSGRWSVMSRP